MPIKTSSCKTQVSLNTSTILIPLKLNKKE